MKPLKIIDLAVIGDITCSTTRAYLTYMANAGYKPRYLFLTQFLYGPIFCNLIERCAYSLSKNLYKRIVKRKAPNFSSLFTETCQLFQKPFEVKVDFLTSSFDFKSLAQETTFLKVWDYSDITLKQILTDLSSIPFLYTNGGIVPPEVFQIPSLKILHIHPGVVPFVKGSDGLFWSLLVRHKIGASCFYMDPGIDTGRLIHQAEYEPYCFPELASLIDPYFGDIYNALLYSYDPHFRGRILTEVLKQTHGDVSKIISSPQNRDAGTTYYAMHPRLIKKVIRTYMC